jgi:hypothetical protein
MAHLVATAVQEDHGDKDGGYGRETNDHEQREHGAAPHPAGPLAGQASWTISRLRGGSDIPGRPGADADNVALQNGPRRQRDDFDPYFIARCECDWVGDGHDASEPDALAATCADAFGHSVNAEPAVGRPMG